MEINRNNYEAFLLDLIEGSLNAEDTQRIHDFLMLNPDCATGLGEEHLWFMEKEAISYPGKNQLKRSYLILQQFWMNPTSTCSPSQDLREISTANRLQIMRTW